MAAVLQPGSGKGGHFMIERRTFPTDYPGCEITVVTEQLGERAWASVSTITHALDGATRTIDLPVSSRRFESQALAQDFGLRQATDWLDGNMPRNEQKTA
jgi:hypothetical protein